MRKFKKWVYWFLLERMYGFKREGAAKVDEYLPSTEFAQREIVYELKIRNAGDKKATARILGYNLFINSANFGSDAGVVVENMLGSYNRFSSYCTMLNEFRNKKSITKIRIIGKDFDSIIHKTLCFDSETSDGHSWHNPHRLYDSWSKLQMQHNMIDVNMGKKIISDGSMYISIDLLPKEELTMVIYEE